MSTEPRPRPPARDRGHRATVLAALLLAASAATLAYVLLGGPDDPVELPADDHPNAAQG
ncbi:hypothetical protein RM550_10035 [Streptomyces sp. DSM 41527]|uniref:Uncharacterized protein n=1 Tax=Streptomyces mooreae TaxID=3075523 RepID=A0ABU2T615_9ACTN|nr:hypothetical protein [Streptomyces sp. DSM 41527]MDT0456079.1 hypothetical protein [Streptomyces sp. DSM 41527]